jgi:DNA-binding beta-propeller fold protein YncE
MRKQILRSLIGFTALALILFTAVQGSAQSRYDLQGRGLVIASDGDFFASSYVDGRIPGNDPRYQDALTLIPLPFTGEAISLNVSNSVLSPPEIMALSPDGKTAFVVENAAQRPANATNRADLPPGRLLTMVDLTNLRQPEIMAQKIVGNAPEAIAVHPAGNWLAIVTNPVAGSNEPEVLQFVPVNGSTLGEPISFPLDQLGIPSAVGELNASAVEWHPSGRYLAINLYRQNRVVFLEFMSAADQVDIQVWGNPVGVDPDPFSGRFTPDGKYYLSANWQRNFEADSLQGRLPDKPSTVSVIRLGNGDRPHQVTTTVESDRSSEGIAVSPDGTLVATANMRDTALPRSSPRFTREASVSLFRLDANTGQLQKAGDFPFEGILPEGITFDTTGEHVIVATFEYLDSAQPTGGLDIWQVSQEPRLALKYTGRINVPHGSHQVLVAP